eukprot:GDKJ01028515.1.p1 GENE.GDKJ01028515.1~~GDKJ01028515.1.p1  ORF type:complete len:693 (+),score=150.71 GDKJ01028515.1:16-2094(+)
MSVTHMEDVLFYLRQLGQEDALCVKAEACLTELGSNKDSDCWVKFQENGFLKEVHSHLVELLNTGVEKSKSETSKICPELDAKILSTSGSLLEYYRRHANCDSQFKDRFSKIDGSVVDFNKMPETESLENQFQKYFQITFNLNVDGFQKKIIAEYANLEELLQYFLEHKEEYEVVFSGSDFVYKPFLASNPHFKALQDSEDRLKQTDPDFVESIKEDINSLKDEMRYHFLSYVAFFMKRNESLKDRLLSASEFEPSAISKKNLEEIVTKFNKKTVGEYFSKPRGAFVEDGKLQLLKKLYTLYNVVSGYLSVRAVDAEKSKDEQNLLPPDFVDHLNDFGRVINDSRSIYEGKHDFKTAQDMMGRFFETLTTHEDQVQGILTYLKSFSRGVSAMPYLRAFTAPVFHDQVNTIAEHLNRIPDGAEAILLSEFKQIVGQDSKVMAKSRSSFFEALKVAVDDAVKEKADFDKNFSKSTESERERAALYHMKGRHVGGYFYHLSKQVADTLSKNTLRHAERTKHANQDLMMADLQAASLPLKDDKLLMEVCQISDPEIWNTRPIPFFDRVEELCTLESMSPRAIAMLGNVLIHLVDLHSRMISAVVSGEPYARLFTDQGKRTDKFVPVNWELPDVPDHSTNEGKKDDATTQDETTNKEDKASVLPWILGSVAVVGLIGGGAYYYFGMQQKKESFLERV